MSAAATEMLETIRKKKGDVLLKFWAEYKKLEAAEQVLAEEAGEPSGDDLDLEMDFYRARLELGNVSHMEAAQWALRRLGAPSKMNDIINLLLMFGFRKASERKEMTNAIFQAMKRKDVFAKHPDAMWGLTDWTSKKRAPGKKEFTEFV